MCFDREVRMPADVVCWQMQEPRVPSEEARAMKIKERIQKAHRAAKRVLESECKTQ